MGALMGYFDGLRRYFVVSGRSSRTQYWGFQLGMALLIGAALFAEARLTGRMPRLLDLGFPSLFAVVVHLVPSLTVSVRRLHDAGHSGWWMLVGLMPVVGTIWLLVKMCEAPAQVGLNRFGPDPRYAAPGLSQTRLAALPGQLRLVAQMMLQQFGQRTA
jgi:uncharacterized membrane protein YhaH (DUF805 family)